MYFNHSYSYKGPNKYIVAHSRVLEGEKPVAAAIKSGSIWGLQFHPEKSQVPGLELLERIIKGSRLV